MNKPEETGKKAAAEAAAAHILPRLKSDTVLGVGTGTTVRYFIEALGPLKGKFDGAVSSSEQTTALLRKQGIAVYDLNAAGAPAFYVDGADEVNGRGQMIKGGGAALTREKIVATAAGEFLCIAADEKWTTGPLGAFPVPVEIIPMARGLVSRALAALGGRPAWRKDTVTDNGNWIVDVTGLDLQDPEKAERDIAQITGVVENGIFARRRADRIFLGGEAGEVREVEPV